jgi:hypothetical protein
MRPRNWLRAALLSVFGAVSTNAYLQKISDKDVTRQFCSGMYGGTIAHINGNITYNAVSTAD